MPSSPYQDGVPRGNLPFTCQLLAENSRLDSTFYKWDVQSPKSKVSRLFTQIAGICMDSSNNGKTMSPEGERVIKILKNQNRTPTQMHVDIFPDNKKPDARCDRQHGYQDFGLHPGGQKQRANAHINTPIQKSSTPGKEHPKESTCKKSSNDFRAN